MPRKAPLLSLFILVCIGILASNAEDEPVQHRVSLKNWREHPWCNQSFRGPIKYRGKELYYHLKVMDPPSGCHLEVVHLINATKTYELFTEALEDFLKEDALIDYQTFYFSEEGIVLGYHTKDFIYPRPNSGIFILGIHQISKMHPELVDKYEIRGVKYCPLMWLIPKGSKDIKSSLFFWFMADEPPEVVTANKLLTPDEMYVTMKKREEYFRLMHEKQKEEKAKKPSQEDL